MSVDDWVAGGCKAFWIGFAFIIGVALFCGGAFIALWIIGQLGHMVFS